MALVFPRDLPHEDAIRVSFSLDAGTVRPDRSQIVMGVEDPLWRASFTVELLDEREAMDWHAWFLSMRGGLRTFLAHDPRRSVPYSVRDGLPLVAGNPWTGAAGLSSVAVKTELALTGLPPGLVLGADDRVSVTQTLSGSVKRSYHSITEGGTADVNGEATVAIEPSLPAHFTTLAAASFVRPKLHLSLDDAAIEIASTVPLEPFTFAATEVW